MDNFKALKREDPVTFRAWMTIVRAVLHLAPRGLSAEWIARVIRQELGEDAQAIFNLAIPKACPFALWEVFPELHQIGDSETMKQIFDALSIGPWEGHGAFSGEREGFEHHIREVLMGRKSDTARLARLRELSGSEQIRASLRAGAVDLYDEIFRRPRRVGFGRVRGMLEVHQSRAADLIDRADDIRKSVYYELAAAGYELAAVAGDEFVLLVPDRSEHGGKHVKQAARKVKALVERTIGVFLAYLPGRCRVKYRSAW